MKKKYRTSDLMNHILTESFVRSCNISMGYSPVFPTVRKTGGKVVLTVPFHRTVKVRETGEEQLYPIRYIVRCAVRDPEDIPDAAFLKNPREKRHYEVMPFVRFIGFEDLAYDPAFADTDFSKPLSSVKPSSDILKKRAGKKDALIGYYDEWIGTLMNNEKPSLSLLDSVRTGLNDLLDEAEKEQYMKLDPEFAKTFLY